MALARWGWFIPARNGRTSPPACSRPDGAGHSDAWSADVDSLLGAQVNANLTSKLVAVVQVIAGENHGYRMHAGELTNTAQVGAGHHDAHLARSGGTLETRDLRVISDTAQFGSFTGHIAYLRSRATATELSRTLFDVFRQFGPQAVAIAEKYSLNDTSVRVISFGALYDPGQWFVTGEWGRAKSHSFVGGTAWHASGGYRFGPLIPYVTCARATSGNLSDPGLELSTLPPLLAGPAAAPNVGLNSLLSSNSVQTTVPLGGRWEFMTNGSFKLQLDHIRVDAGSSGVFTDTEPGFQLAGQANIFSAMFDFVF